jgi:hypothetical protein
VPSFSVPDRIRELLHWGRNVAPHFIVKGNGDVVQYHPIDISGIVSHTMESEGNRHFAFARAFDAEMEAAWKDHLTHLDAHYGFLWGHRSPDYKPGWNEAIAWLEGRERAAKRDAELRAEWPWPKRDAFAPHLWPEDDEVDYS